MSQTFLDDLGVAAILEQVCSVSVSKTMQGDPWQPLLAKGGLSPKHSPAESPRYVIRDDVPWSGVISITVCGSVFIL